MPSEGTPLKGPYNQGSNGATQYSMGKRHIHTYGKYMPLGMGMSVTLQIYIPCIHCIFLCGDLLHSSYYKPFLN